MKKSAGKRFLESPLNRARWSRDRALKAIKHYEHKIKLLQDEAAYYDQKLADLRSRQKPSDMTEETRRQFEESRRAVEADIAARSQAASSRAAKPGSDGSL